ncbi:MAG: enoyl-CoA hydratase/isomerase family protein [Candidatus Obscuribacterales bacterium]|nr:enoyl-CoA hydratase/isomerase family protein [Candidatus Obscuribacterales bacterium]
MNTEVTVEKNMQLNILESGIACINIDLRGSKVNTLGETTMKELNELIDKVIANREIKGLVISSGKEDSFIAGADVKEIQAIQEKTLSEALQASKLGKEIFQKIADMPINTVAAINGICLGGGTELAFACKHRIASKNAKIGLPEIKLGFVPGWGGCVRLPRLLGVATALDLILTGKVLSADKAKKLALILEVVESKDLLARAMKIAREGAPAASKVQTLQAKVQELLLESNSLGLSIMRDIAYKGMMAQTKGKYPAAKEAIDLIIRGFQLPEKEAFELESNAFAKLAMSEVSRNLVGIFFAQTESKKLPLELKDKKISTVAVLGAGVMGAGIAQAAAKAGYKVIVKDVKQEFVDKGKETVRKLFAGLVLKHRLKQEEMDKIMSSMIFTTDYAPLADVDLVIEAVIEDLDAKRKVLAELENAAKKNFVFGSNTSSLSIDKMAESAKRPESVVGIHFFNPVHKMPLVEIVKGAKTDEESLALAMSFALALDKTTVVTADSPGFVVNRILAPYMREAAVLAESGVPVEEIDRAMKSFGMPMGPMALLDEVGLDIAGKVVHVMYEALGERLAEPALMKEIQRLKLLGKKGGKGIYLYNEKGRPDGVNPEFQACIKAETRKIQKSQIQDRLVLLMLNEAVRCLEESVVTSAAQLDLALIFGIGFPPYEGGILRYADKQGIRLLCDKLELLAQIEGSRYEPCELLRTKARNREKFYDSK